MNELVKLHLISYSLILLSVIMIISYLSYIRVILINKNEFDNISHLTYKGNKYQKVDEQIV